jgi:FkbM family methyltransferase
VGKEMSLGSHAIEAVESAQVRLLGLHKAAIWGLRKLPEAKAKFGLRVYDKALRLMQPVYIGRTYFGALIRCNLSDLIQFRIFHFGIWEPEVSQVITSILAPGDVFIDIGANIGYDSLLAASLVGPTGAVVAIEASPKTFDMLKKNLSLNEDPSNIRAVNVAASDHYGTLDLFEISQRNLGAATTIEGRGGKFIASVDAMPLTEILREDEIKRARLIKIDVEGAESTILNNIIDCIDAFPLGIDIIVETSPDDAEASRAVFKKMKRAGFTAFEIENDYEKERYLFNRPLSPLIPAHVLPSNQCDILYTRRT